MRFALKSVRGRWRRAFVTRFHRHMNDQNVGRTKGIYDCLARCTFRSGDEGVDKLPFFDYFFSDVVISLK